jgi:formylglycine-generating enzyme required for sulfatase activity/Tol biopolymer transport system component
MPIFKPLSKNAAQAGYLMSFLLLACFLTGCASAPQTATPDVAALSTAAVATVYANLTLSPVSTPTPSPTPLPSAITDEFGVPMVLVPGGPFLMGRDESAEGQPELEVTIGGYYIDTYEVTNQRYMACVEAGVCQAPYNPGSYTHASYYLNPDFANYPVLLSGPEYIAEAYCAWRGTHIPTEIEWEKALRGPDGRNYSWGNADPDGTRANLCDVNCYQNYASQWWDDGYADVAPVGSFPAGASPYGVMDLVGNVNERVALVPELSGGNPYKTLGGAFDTNAIHNYVYQSAWFNTGFRCASGPVSEPVSPVIKPLRSTVTPTPTWTPEPPTPTATIRPAARSTNVYSISFISQADDESMRLQLVNDDGSGLRTLFSTDAGQLARAIYDPTWSPDGKTLYFIAELRELVDGHSRFLYQVAPFETDPEKLAYRPIEGLPNLDYNELILSPDGRYLALIYTPHPDEGAYLGTGIYNNPTLGLFDLKTGVWKTLFIPNYNANLSEICLSPDGWSPNSREFSFVASVNAVVGQENSGGSALISSHWGHGGVGADLFVADTTGVVKKIGRVSDTEIYYQCPAWAGAGKQIIYLGNDETGFPSLAVARPDSSKLTSLLSYGDVPNLFQLSPDRLHLIAVFSDGSKTELWHQAANAQGLFLKDSDIAPRESRFLPPWRFLGAVQNTSAYASVDLLAWSPDGSRIVFDCGAAQQICTVNVDGSDLSNLTAGSPPGYLPTWSPDGLKIAYIAEAQGKVTLVVMNIDGSERRTLVTDLDQDAKWWADISWSSQAVEP